MATSPGTQPEGMGAAACLLSGFRGDTLVDRNGSPFYGESRALPIHGPHGKELVQLLPTCGT